MISFDILSKRFSLKGKGLSDARVLTMIKNEYDFTLHFLFMFIKFSNQISDERLNAVS